MKQPVTRERRPALGAAGNLQQHLAELAALPRV